MFLIGTKEVLKHKYGITDEDIKRGYFMGHKIVVSQLNYINGKNKKL